MAKATTKRSTKKTGRSIGSKVKSLKNKAVKTGRRVLKGSERTVRKPATRTSTKRTTKTVARKPRKISTRTSMKK